ncbi:hypothetical protein GTZ99_09280 [Novosphingobium sp. FSY-8]|uniref:Uncharacterized protein n=1 Tax=Novosphingobium ovatum TaxID=1908523 RepID=A0ABW9XDY0_9SPHN|nr:hypothetical protein [Novosphingobium ovatum]NBC36749.1 hypothetical protein [Novosphingobium ovatum]
MSKRLVVFVGWCGLMLASTVYSALFAWSPFGTSARSHQGPDRTQRHGTHGGGWFYGGHK